MVKTARVDFKALARQYLSPSRYRHSLAVAGLSRNLARRYGWDPQLAYDAGLLHDIAKEWSHRKLIAYVKRHPMKIPGYSFIRRNGPAILHSYVGANVIFRRGWIKNSAALRAIASHTLGDLKMSVPQMILYVADFAATDRRYPSSRRVRRRAFINLKSAFQLAFAQKIEWNVRAHKPLHPNSMRIWNALNK